MPEFVQASIKKHVAIVPGNEFMVDSTKPCQSIRMNFSAASMENIEKGIQILGELTYQFCKYRFLPLQPLLLRTRLKY